MMIHTVFLKNRRRCSLHLPPILKYAVSQRSYTRIHPRNVFFKRETCFFRQLSKRSSLDERVFAVQMAFFSRLSLKQNLAAWGAAGAVAYYLWVKPRRGGTTGGGDRSRERGSAPRHGE